MVNPVLLFFKYAHLLEEYIKEDESDQLPTSHSFTYVSGVRKMSVLRDQLRWPRDTLYPQKLEQECYIHKPSIPNKWKNSYWLFKKW
jgi:hypothetical protein